MSTFHDITCPNCGYTVPTELSKREYFAIHAPIDVAQIAEKMFFGQDMLNGTDTNRAILMAITALTAVEYADALIEQLNKE